MKDSLDWLVHKNNLIGKIRGNYKGKGKEFDIFKNEKYLPYLTAQTHITGITKSAIIKKLKLYDNYSRSVDSFNKRGWITAQSKFRPTVLEEFCGFLFKDLPQIKLLKLGFFKRSIYAGLKIDSKGNVTIETRDIDFCIGKEVTASMDNKRYKIRIPIVAIECKTYLDKTMLSGAQFTAQRLKGGAPRVKTLLLIERNEVDLNEIPSESPIDQIYVLRDGENDPAASTVVWSFFTEVNTTLKRVAKEHVIKLPGKLFIL